MGRRTISGDSGCDSDQAIRGMTICFNGNNPDKAYNTIQCE